MSKASDTIKQHIIIMAAGLGRRMGDSLLPYQLLKIGKLPCIVHLFYLADRLGLDVVLVLAKINKSLILDSLIDEKHISISDSSSSEYVYRSIKIRVAVQEIVNGTSEAVKAARDQIFLCANNKPIVECGEQDTVIVLSANVPLASYRTISELSATLNGTDSSIKCAVYGKRCLNHYGYDKIVTVNSGNPCIIEQNERESVSNPELLNTGIYAFKAQALFAALDHVTNSNSNSEFYLTDVPHIIASNNANSISTVYENMYTKYNEVMRMNTCNQLESIGLEYMKKFSVKNVIRGTKLNISDKQVAEYLDCLSELTDTGLSTDSHDDILRVKAHLLDLPHKYKAIYCLEYDSRIVGTFSIFIEPKTIHNLASVGHIEDVVIIKEFRGLGLGELMLAEAKDVCATRDDVYKIILECSEHPSLVKFYEGTGFRIVGNSMRLDLLK
jgi:GNAT superfamily N-acetyltransferase/NDP-sugar pyrophosphorylase family protein